MNKISVIVLTKVQEAITDILALELPPAADLPPAPTPPAAELPPAPTPPAAELPLDSEGLPWDKRIHSTGKTLMAKGGTWKLLRGVESLLVAQVKTELRQAHHEVIPPPVGVGLTWAQLMEKIAGAGTGPDEVTAACQKFNVQNVGTLQDTPVLVPLVAKELGF